MGLVDASGTPLVSDGAGGDVPAPTEPAPDAMRDVLNRLAAFSKAYQGGATDEAVTLLGEALGLFATAQNSPAVRGTDYEIQTEAIEDPEKGAGTRITVQDLTDVGRDLMGAWSGLIASMEQQGRESQLENLERAMRGMMGALRRMQTQLDNQAVDIAKMQRKIRGKD